MKRKTFLIVPVIFFAISLSAYPANLIVNGAGPNGSDDTAAIQAALNQCVANGPGCTVQLAAGTYLIKQIFAENFHGTFKGKGMDVTILQAVPKKLPVNQENLVWNSPPSVNNPYPMLVLFFGGDITVSDMTIRALESNQLESWYIAEGDRQETIKQGQRYQKEGRYAEAEKSYRLALAEAEKLGAEDPRLAKSLNDLAVLLQRKGNYAEAERLCRRALGIRERVFGPEHPEVADSLNNLAVLHRSLRNYRQARLLHEQAIVIREKTLGQEHPSLALSLNNRVLSEICGYERRDTGLMENAAAVEIRKSAGIPTAAWEGLAKKRRDFPTFPTGPTTGPCFFPRGQAAQRKVTT